MGERTAPVRILQVHGRINRGGAESRVMDLYREMDRERVQFDFLVHEGPRGTGHPAPSSDELMAVRDAQDYDEEILSMGGRIYALPRLSVPPAGTGFLSYKRACRRFFEEHRGEWRVVQGHMTSTASVYLAEAKRAGVPVTVAHARSAGTDPGLKGAVTGLLRRRLSDSAFLVRTPDGGEVKAVDRLFACSLDAARAVFGDGKAIILPNAIHVEKFRFSQTTGLEIRRELGIGDARVIGHVGSFRYAKNHELLIRSFRKLCNLDCGRKYILLLIGRGDTFEEMKSLVHSLEIESSVIFAGVKSDIERYYQAMDVFAFPSRYEGLPGSVMEAQAAGLPCVVSDRIAGEIDVTSLVHRESIGTDNDSKEAQLIWARRLKELSDESEQNDRTEVSEKAVGELIRAGFDVKNQASVLERFYLGDDSVLEELYAAKKPHSAGMSGEADS
ncbi:MAG: glycosyltransferase [Lachnospiraceae bacterium]|nr:glycosyltransferase [Lachnospiraceae bacterium]